MLRDGDHLKRPHLDTDQFGRQSHIIPELADFIAARDSVYLATSNAAASRTSSIAADHRGFLHVLDAQTIGFADFAGNKQYITLGNIQENPMTHVFLMDYAHRRRIKIWGELSAAKGDAKLNARF